MTYTFVCGNADNGAKGTTEALDVPSCLKKIERMGMAPTELYHDGQLVWQAAPKELPLHLKVQAASLDEANRMIASLPAAAPPIPVHVTRDEVESMRPSKRKQQFIMGEHKAIRGLIDNALALDGKVLHVSVNSDIKGNLIVAMVVEHNEERE